MTKKSLILVMQILFGFVFLMSEITVYAQNFETIYNEYLGAQTLEQAEMITQRHFGQRPKRLAKIFDAYNVEQLSALPEPALREIFKVATFEDLLKFHGLETYNPESGHILNPLAELVAIEYLSRFDLLKMINGPRGNMQRDILLGGGVVCAAGVCVALMPWIVGSENMAYWPLFVSLAAGLTAGAGSVSSQRRVAVSFDREVTRKLIAVYRFVRENQVPVSRQLANALADSVQLISKSIFYRAWDESNPRIDMASYFQALEEYSKTMEAADYVDDRAFNIALSGGHEALKLLRIFEERMRNTEMAEEVIHFEAIRKRITEASFQQPADSIDKLLKDAGVKNVFFGFSTGDVEAAVRNAKIPQGFPEVGVTAAESETGRVVAQRNETKTAFVLELPLEILEKLGSNSERAIQNGRLDILLGKGVWLRFPELAENVFVFHRLNARLDVDLLTTGPVEIWTTPWSGQAQLLERLEGLDEGKGRLTIETIDAIYQRSLSEFFSSADIGKEAMSDSQSGGSSILRSCGYLLARLKKRLL